jgi:hypothetical protein
VRTRAGSWNQRRLRSGIRMRTIEAEKRRKGLRLREGGLGKV